jgi:hypothetical protein
MNQSPNWQPIATAPRDRTHILVFWPAGTRSYERAGMTTAYWDTEFRGGWLLVESGEMATSCRLDQEPTHWMPLPCPPQAPSN